MAKQDELAQRDRKHRDKYWGLMGKTGDTWRWVETITKTGETDQGVTHHFGPLCFMLETNCKIIGKEVTPMHMWISLFPFFDIQRLSYNLL